MFRIRYANYIIARGEREDLRLVPICSNHLQATDARDNIFGLLGLMKKSAIVPDYQKPIEGVYASFSRTWWKEIRTLDFLNEAGLTRRPKHSKICLPSWVPD
jgi:hypothetical protein